MTAIILKFPPRSPSIRVERENDAPGWMVVSPGREHGWLHGDFHAALTDARDLAVGFGAAVRSSAAA